MFNCGDKVKVVDNTSINFLETGIITEVLATKRKVTVRLYDNPIVMITCHYHQLLKIGSKDIQLWKLNTFYV